MTICYNKLWKLLIDKNMKKKDLRLATGMSTTALAKLGKNPVSYTHLPMSFTVSIIKVFQIECRAAFWPLYTRIVA